MGHHVATMDRLERHLNKKNHKAYCHGPDYKSYLTVF